LKSDAGSSTMKDDRMAGDRQSGGPAKNPRENRLKLALRENLKRRKLQARERADIPAAPSNPAAAAPDDGSGKRRGE
jgi:hypothetical protein